jgi:hypothetical protein
VAGEGFAPAVQQIVQEAADRAFNYLASYRISDDKFVRLSDESLRSVNVLAAIARRLAPTFANTNSRRAITVVATRTLLGRSRDGERKLLMKSACRRPRFPSRTASVCCTGR